MDCLIIGQVYVSLVLRLFCGAVRVLWLPVLEFESNMAKAHLCALRVVACIQPCVYDRSVQSYPPFYTSPQLEQTMQRSETFTQPAIEAAYRDTNREFQKVLDEVIARYYLKFTQIRVHVSA